MSSRSWHNPPQDPLYEQKNIFNELVSRELEIIWEHSFAKMPESEGITDKFFDYSAGVTRSGPEAVVGEGEYLQTKEVGDYGGGQPVVAGSSFDINQWPQGDQDAWVGYTNTQDGYGLGIRVFDVDEGTPGATEAGVQPYVFFERFGNDRVIVPQEHWNINTLQADDADEGPPLTLTDGITLRLPHACYFHSNATVEIGVKLDNGGFALVPVHEFNHRGGPMWAVSDLPVRTEVSGTEGNGFAASLTTVHYEGETGRGIKRSNGETFTVSKNGGSVLSTAAFPAWTYVMSFRKRAGWGDTPVTPTSVSLNATDDLEAQITVGADLSNTAYSLPEDTSSSECAVEYDLVSWDIAGQAQKGTNTTVNSRGEREWIDVVPGGKNTPSDVSEQLENVVLAAEEPVSLFVRRAADSNQAAVNYAALTNGGGF